MLLDGYKYNFSNATIIKLLEFTVFKLNVRVQLASYCYSIPLLAVTHTTQLSDVCLVLVDVDLKLTHSGVFVIIARAPPHFNVVTHFLA